MPLPALGAVVAGLAGTISRYLVAFLVIRILCAFGITGFSIAGVTWLIDYYESIIESYFGNIGADVSGVLLMAGVGDALAIIASSWSAAVGIKVIRGGFKGFKVA